jgi:hypothetical protein
MSNKLASGLIARRTVLRVAGGAMAAALARLRIGQSVGFTVALVVPPHWLKEAHDLLRKIRTPRIPERSVRILCGGGDDRSTIQQALDDVGASGGGRVTLAPGIWRVNGPIYLRSHVELHIEDGAQILFSADRDRYLPPVLTRWEGTDLYGYSPCVYAVDVHDVAITGKGSLAMDNGGDMQGWRLEQTEAQKKLRAMGASGGPLSSRIFGEGSFLRPSFIQFLRCQQVRIEGVRVFDFPFWGARISMRRGIPYRGLCGNGRTGGKNH